jgi:hypothetical protein
LAAATKDADAAATIGKKGNVKVVPMSESDEVKEMLRGGLRK